MRLVDIDREPKVQYYVYATPIGDQHFYNEPSYVVDDKYFDTIEEAEQLKAECESKPNYISYRIFKNVEPITDFPIVEAIPIEWIKRYIDITLDSGNSQMIGFKATIINEMLEEWKKENEM